jgi:WD40 repeat protein
VNRRLALAIGVALAVVLVGVAVSVLPPPLSTPSPSSAASASSPALNSATPSPSPVAPGVLSSVHTTALGRIAGSWVFLGKRIPRPERNRVEVQIVARPLAGGPWVIAIAFDVAGAGIPEAVYDTTPYLRRQFSPDGRRMVFSVEAQLVLFDLVTGEAKPLGVSGYLPSWSKDGSQIAFLFEKPVADVVPPPLAIAVIPERGGLPREIAVVGSQRHSAEWSPDGSKLVLAQEGAITVVEVATGRITTRVAAISSTSASFAHWRAASPELAIATSGCEDRAQIVVLTTVDSAPRTLVEAGEGCGPLELRDPRWNPAATDELLYVLARGEPGREFDDYQTHLLNVATGKDTRLPFAAYEATWSWDGRQIVYLAKAAGAPFADVAMVWNRNGSGEREVLRAFGFFDESFFSVASLDY